MVSWLDLFFLTGAYFGAALWVYRAWPRHARQDHHHDLVADSRQWPKVSIIVPARNEERNLPTLLRSLRDLDYPDFEVIVVDDESTDQTYAIAESFGFQVISGAKRPEGWAGKPWACHQGAQHAAGDYLLFTDADTMHLKASLRQSIDFIQSSRAGLISTVPFHANPKSWARMLGPFQALLFTLTAPYQQAKPGRLFAIGQYLLFERGYYQRSGGHVAVKDEFAEDLALARHCLAQGGNYQLHWGRSWYHVDMYESFGDFFRGWRRNFRQGMKYSHALVFLETALLIAALAGAGQWFETRWAWLPTVVSLGVVARMQVELGRFSNWGLLGFPIGISVFIGVSVAASWDRLTGRALVWKQRSYHS